MKQKWESIKNVQYCKSMESIRNGYCRRKVVEAADFIGTDVERYALKVSGTAKIEGVLKVGCSSEEVALEEKNSADETWAPDEADIIDVKKLADEAERIEVATHMAREGEHAVVNFNKGTMNSCTRKKKKERERAGALSLFFFLVDIYRTTQV